MPRALLAGLVLLLMAGHLVVLAASSSYSSSSSSFTVAHTNSHITPTTTSTTTTTKPSVRPLQKQQPPFPPFLLPFAEGHQQQQDQEQAAAAAAPLEIINPWLSACDLQPASATDLQGACSATMWGPGTSMCLPSCRRGNDVHADDILFAASKNKNNNNKKRNSNSTSNQCLFYLEESHKDVVCDHRRGYSPEERRDVLEKLRIRHCCEHSVLSALPFPAVPGDHDDVLRNDDACHRLLDALLEVDALAARMSCEYAEVLTRYDCGQNYSIAHNCNDCQEAYRQWVCSSLVPHFATGVDSGAFKNGARRLRPCRSVCQAVEQRCPYMLPGDRAPAHPTQYAGEPTFLCLDPNIPETGEQRAKSSHGDEDCCYTHCGTPGRGLCVQCPGATNKTQPSEPFNDTPVPVRCAAGTAPPKSSNCKATATATTTTTTISTTTTTTTSTSTTSTTRAATAHAVSAARTHFCHFHLVCAWWTACTIVLFSYYSRTISDVLLQLLVLCANCVRTPLSRIKTKWRSCS
ncbi:uncharacterized protein LOC108741152 [Agrilus planipennis]|uniref:Uncharacterized protein LOC108741152 n=1 Tax=Agrilus planipennis TaxID=224129 RepID=A0A1W4X5J9_AGRPL|nr:uncharacterized protein LOC108741152 [Agrilus planipennis]